MERSGSQLQILYLIDSLAPGGTERSLAALAPAYARLGVTLDVAVLEDRDGLKAELESAGARVFSLAHDGGRVQHIRRAVALIRTCRPHLVHTSLFEADVTGRMAARLASTPVVSSLVNESYGPEHLDDPAIRRVRLRAAQTLDAMTARLAVRMHAVSARVADVMAQRLRYPRDRIDVIARGRDPQLLGRRTAVRRTTTRAALDAREQDTLVLAVARHEHQKGLEHLVSALAPVRAALPTARLLIAGRDGTATAAIKARVAELGLESSVTLLGARADVPDLLAAADVFVLPSRREGMPGAVIEAMALEVPIVASDLPQVREVTGPHAALLVPVDDDIALAAAIVDCVAEPVAARERAIAGHRRFLELFTIDRTASEMVAFYRRALAGSRGPFRASSRSHT